ncbi:MAG: type II secretion system F family protein, partial [Actinomycetota bacterium]
DRVAKKLQLAGSPVGWDAERVLAFKVIGAVAGVFGGFVLSTVVQPAPFISIVAIALLAFVGFVVPDSMLNRRVQARQKEVLKTLSDTLDLLTISVEAGLSLNAAIAQVVQNVPGVLSAEFARMLQEIQLGVPRSEAFRHLADRTDVDELNGFALAMIQADVFGVSIASVLRTQAQQLRIKRRQAAEAKAQQTPVKIVFPLVLCILPALFVVIVGPGAIQIATQLIQD